MVNRIYISVRVHPEILVIVWRKVNMRNLEHSKRVSEANNSCGLCKPCFSKRICKKVRRRSERVTESLRIFCVENVPPERFQNIPTSYNKQGEAVLFAAHGAVPFVSFADISPHCGESPSKMLSHFFTPFSARQKNGAGCFALCGERPGTLSLDPASLLRKA